MSEIRLNRDIILSIAPKSLIGHMVDGVYYKNGLYIGIMYDIDENDPVLGLETGRLYVANTKARSSYCQLLRQCPNNKVPELCKQFTSDKFLEVKTKAIKNPLYEGDIFKCIPGGLLCFSFPIVEKVNNTFIGVIFGGQKRPIESNRDAIKRLNTTLSLRENKELNSIKLQILQKSFLQVAQISDSDFSSLKNGEIKTIANDIALVFEPYMRQKKDELQKDIEQNTINNIYSALIETQGIPGFFTFLRKLPSMLNPWMQFDWCIFIEAKKVVSSQSILEITSAYGRGIRAIDGFIGDKISVEHSAEKDLNTIQHKPSFASFFRKFEIPEDSEYDWIPFPYNNTFLGGILFGSSPKHLNTSYDKNLIEEIKPRLNEVVIRITLKYENIIALENERKQRIEADKKRDEAQKAIDSSQDLLTSLTHQVKRPLIMVQQTLSNLRMKIGNIEDPELTKDLELGQLLSKHTEIMCRGISKALAGEATGDYDYSINKIDVRKELELLCEAMKKASGRKDVDFELFKQSPTIEMDLNSFLFVFYVLIDNAIKYSDSNEVIQLICDEERQRAAYAFKVRSYGLPILEKEKDKVFEKYWRGERAKEKDESGIGLGCWAAREHMKIYGGEIDLEVNGKLSVFIVYPPKILR